MWARLGSSVSTLPRPSFTRGEETAERWGELEFCLSPVVTGDGLEGVRTAFHRETRVLAGFVVGGNFSSLLLRASGVTEWNQESGTRPSTGFVFPRLNLGILILFRFLQHLNIWPE